MKPYQHHHGRQSVTEYLSYVPRPIRDLALRSKVQDWDFIHVYSTDQAILRVIDKANMTDKEITFWARVYRHYLGKCDLPDPDTHPSRMVKKHSRPENIVDPSHTLTENVRRVFRAENRPLTRREVLNILTDAGVVCRAYSVGHCFSYLVRRKEIAIQHPVKRAPNFQNKYYWNG